MTDLAPLLQGFFTDKLMLQRQASPHTIAAYRDTFKLLLGFAHQHLHRPPVRLGIADLDAPMIGAFLQYLETSRGNSAATRNARLAAVHSLFRYLAPRVPEHMALIQRVLAIPSKRFDRAIVSYLTTAETDALVAAPDQNTWTGRRDHALLLVAVHTGLRVTELTSLKLHDVQLSTGAHLRCHGKGRKERCTPLTTATTKVLRTWLTEHGGTPADPLFPTRRGTPLSRDAVQRLVAKHATAAATQCLSLRDKKITPHTLRHSTAMALLSAGVDISVIALWLGHETTETTQVYLNSQELRQAGEKPQVARSWWRRNSTSGLRMTAARPGAPRERSLLAQEPPSRRSRLSLGALHAHRRGERLLAAGLRPPERAFRQFQYLTPPEHADMALKERAISRTTPHGVPSGRFKAPDSLLAFLNSL